MFRPARLPNISRRAFLASTLVAAPALSRAGTQATDDLDDFVRQEMSKANIPGLALGIAKAGAVQVARGYGLADLEHRRPVTANTVFHIASVTKLVTATMLVKLLHEKRSVLDEPIGKYLDFAVVNPHAAATPITFRHLLTHTSSISDAKYYEIDFRSPGADATLELADLLKNYLRPGGRYYSADGCFLKAAPGAAWDYSNIGYGLLGHLASRIGGTDMRELTREQIFAPLGMGHTYWSIAETPAAESAVPYDVADGKLIATQPVGFPDWSAGMLRSSVGDLAKFVAACANGGVASGNRILPAAAQAEMFTSRTSAQLPDWLTGQALGWMASNLDGAPGLNPIFNHWGGDPGVFTAVYAEPGTRTGVVIFTNVTASSASKAAIKSIAAKILRN